MHGAPAEKVRLGEPRDHPEDALLLARPEARLKPDEVPHATAAVFHAELRDRVCLATRSRIAKADRLHRPEPKRLPSAARHLFDRHAPLEVRDRVELLARVLIRRDQRIEKRLVLLPRERTIE